MDVPTAVTIIAVVLMVALAGVTVHLIQRDRQIRVRIEIDLFRDAKEPPPSSGGMDDDGGSG